LARIIEVMSGTRAFMLLNFRPEYSADWMRRADYQQVALRPLGPEAIDELLRSLLGDHPSLAALVPRLRERAKRQPVLCGRAGAVTRGSRHPGGHEGRVLFE
jgi:hypothetical protein